jgi:hypothetical protein
MTECFTNLNSVSYRLWYNHLVEKFDVLTGKFEAFSLFKDGRKRREPTIQEDSPVSALMYEHHKLFVYRPTLEEQSKTRDEPSIFWTLVSGLIIIAEIILGSVIVIPLFLLIGAIIFIPLFSLILGVYGSAVSGMATVGIPSILGVLILCYAMSRIVKESYCPFIFTRPLESV